MLSLNYVFADQRVVKFGIKYTKNLHSVFEAYSTPKPYSTLFSTFPRCLPYKNTLSKKSDLNKKIRFKTEN